MLPFSGLAGAEVASATGEADGVAEDSDVTAGVEEGATLGESGTGLIRLKP